MSHNVEMNIRARLATSTKPAKRFTLQNRVIVTACISLLLVVGTAYAETIKEKINVLFKVQEVPVLSKRASHSARKEDQQKSDALNDVRKANQVSRDKVEALSPIKFMFPVLPDGYVLVGEDARRA